MKASARALLVALLVVAFAAEGRAQVVVLDDPEQAGNPFLLDLAARTATTPTMNLGSQGRDCLLLVLNVTVCTACNVTAVLQLVDPANPSAFANFFVPTTVVATGFTRYLLCNSGSLGSASGITTYETRKPPPYWRVNVTFTGTNATYSLAGMLY